MAHARILKEMQGALEKGDSAGKYLHKVFEFGMRNHAWKKKMEELLTDEDFQAIQCMEITSASASEVANQPIRRAVFVIADPAVYAKMEQVFGTEPGDTHGVHIPGGAFGQLPGWRETGVTLVKDRPATMTHEIRHSIDPNFSQLEQRKGYDRLLEEMFAEYQTKIVEGDDWQKYERFFVPYYEQYSADAEEWMSSTEWAQLISAAVNALKRLRAEHGDIETQRKMVQCKTIAEFLAL